MCNGEINIIVQEWKLNTNYENVDISHLGLLHSNDPFLNLQPHLGQRPHAPFPFQRHHSFHNNKDVGCWVLGCTLVVQKINYENHLKL